MLIQSIEDFAFHNFAIRYSQNLMRDRSAIQFYNQLIQSNVITYHRFQQI